MLCNDVHRKIVMMCSIYLSAHKYTKSSTSNSRNVFKSSKNFFAKLDKESLLSLDHGL